jgi:hypothetical protein
MLSGEGFANDVPERADPDRHDVAHRRIVIDNEHGVQMAYLLGQASL